MGDDNNPVHIGHKIYEWKFTTAGELRTLEMEHHQSKWQFFLDKDDVGDFAPQSGMNPFKQEKHTYTLVVPPLRAAVALEGQLQMEWAHSHWKYTLTINGVPVSPTWVDEKVKSSSKPAMNTGSPPEVFGATGGAPVHYDRSKDDHTGKEIAKFKFKTGGKEREVQVRRNKHMWEIDVDGITATTVSTEPGLFGKPKDVEEFDKTFEVSHGGRSLDARLVGKAFSASYNANDEQLTLTVNDTAVQMSWRRKDGNIGIGPIPEVCAGDESGKAPASTALVPSTAGNTTAEGGPKTKNKAVQRARKAEQPSFCCGPPANKDSEIVTGFTNQCYLWGEEVFME